MPTCSMGSIASMRGNTWEHAPPERGPASQARRGQSTRDPSWGSLGTGEVPHTPVDLNERCKEHRLWITGECAAAMAHILRGLAGGGRGHTTDTSRTSIDAVASAEALVRQK